MSDLSQIINEYLDKTGITADRFAKELEIAPSSLSQYRHGKPASPQIEKRIIQATGQDIEIIESNVEYIPLPEAAQLLGVSVLQVREGLRQNIWPFNLFGYAIKYEWSERYNYVIYRKKFNEFLKGVA